MSEFKIGKRQLARQKWLDEYNNSLPQKKWYCEEFQQEYSIAIGGIYDSEYDEYMWANVDIYGRIERIKKQQKNARAKVFRQIKNEMKKKLIPISDTTLIASRQEQEQ
jgi:hypothetical protein